MALLHLYAIAELPRTTLLRCLDGQQFRADTRPSGHKLTETEEDLLTQWILYGCTWSSTSACYCARNGQSSPCKAWFCYSPFNWPKLGIKFVKRRDELRTRYSRRYDYQRAQNKNPKAKTLSKDSLMTFQETGALRSLQMGGLPIK